MTKTVESLTAQLRDVARAFYLEVWGQALIAVVVSDDSKLRAPDRVYYPPALCLAPNFSQPSSDPSSAPTFSLTQLVSTPPVAPTIDKEKEQPPPIEMVEVETEEATEVAPLKRKKKEKEQEKKGGKEKEASA